MHKRFSGVWLGVGGDKCLDQTMRIVVPKFSSMKNKCISIASLNVSLDIKGVTMIECAPKAGIDYCKKKRVVLFKQRERVRKETSELRKNDS